MSKTVERIVAGYVKSKNRRAIEGLRAHRRKLLADLQAVTGLKAAGSLKRFRTNWKRSRRALRNSSRCLVQFRKTSGSNLAPSAPTSSALPAL